MNPLSSFSFGQLIKTFLPGLIATVSPILLFETLYAWPRPAPASLLGLLQQAFVIQLGGQNLLGAITLLALIALVLGFSLNSVHWVLFHDRCRARCTSPELSEAKKRLERVVARALDETLPGNYGKLPPSIPGFFLSHLDLAKNNFLRESYFAWYEFDMNSLVALAVVLITFIVTSIALTVHWALAWRQEALLILIVTAMFAGAMRFLWLVALRNLKTYEERFFWFLLGTLHLMKAEKPVAQPAPCAKDKPAGGFSWGRLALAILQDQLRPPR